MGNAGSFESLAPAQKKALRLLCGAVPLPPDHASWGVLFRTVLNQPLYLQPPHAIAAALQQPCKDMGACRVCLQWWVAAARGGGRWRWW